MVTCKSFDVFLTRIFSNLGVKVSNNTTLFILVPLLVSAFFGSGFQRLLYESDIEELFVPLGAQSSEEREAIQERFPMNSSRYVVGTETELPTMVEMILTEKSGGNVINKVD